MIVSFPLPDLWPPPNSPPVSLFYRAPTLCQSPHRGLRDDKTMVLPCGVDVPVCALIHISWQWCLGKLSRGEGPICQGWGVVEQGLQC